MLKSCVLSWSETLDINEKGLGFPNCIESAGRFNMNSLSISFFCFLKIYLNKFQCLKIRLVLLTVDKRLMVGIIIFADDWSLEMIKDQVFQSAFFWMCVIDIIDGDDGLTYKYNMKTCIDNVHLYCNNISAFVRKIKNLQEKIKKQNKHVLLENTVIEVKKIESLGEECKKHGITEHWLLNPEKINIDMVTRKLILELRVYKNRNKITDKTFAVWVKYLCNLPTLPHLGIVWLC